MKSLALLLMLCGCTSLGDVQGLGRAGETLRTIDSVCKRIEGHSCDDRPPNAPQLNRTVGEIKQMGYYKGLGSVPALLQELQTLTSYPN